MAFCQPTYAPTSRSTTSHEPNQASATAVPPPLHRDVQESQEWVLFPARSTTQTQTTSSERTPRTAGLSRLSDFGSLAARSRQDDGIACEATDGSVEDDEGLDSLDEGLHAFQEPFMLQRSGYFNQSGSILPRHDGLGTFPVSTPPIQEQLWHFEQYNPRKRSIGGHQRRRSSVQRKLDAIENHDAAVIESERTQRIEKWRLEQSRILLDEIEKQTRRRSISTTSRRVERDTGNVGLERIIKESVEAGTETHITDTIQGGSSAGPEDNESFWQRVTRRVIRDFIGIDDSMLSVIFGESVVEERSAAARNPSAGPASSKSIRLDPTIPNTSTWESRLLDRIARELGILVKHLSDHPGAFSTPLNPSTPDYAGIPITVPTSSRSQRKPPLSPTNLSPTSFTFPPTLQDAPHLNSPSTADSTHAALWGIEEEPPTPDPNQDDLSYWESPPDLKTIFRFLHTRFTSSRPPPRPLNKNIATTSTPDSLRRAAIIRQYHPLVSNSRGTWEQRRRGSLRRGRSGSSCASSVVGSARRLGGLRGGSLGSSSRNYWDLGESAVGSGGASAIGVGGMGAWGEV